jgi:diadenosine tetraphosphate (Ap4A) HIT family hydrolase
MSERPLPGWTGSSCAGIPRRPAPVRGMRDLECFAERYPSGLRKRLVDYLRRIGYQPRLRRREGVMADEFALDPRIEETSVPVADWPLAQLRLKDDARFHWLLLVPRLPGVVELTDLAEEEYLQLNAEVLAAHRLLQEIARPDKVNVATLGNVVPQLHVHVVGRFASDPAWPDAIWCHGVGPVYPPHALAILAERYGKAARARFAAL